MFGTKGKTPTKMLWSWFRIAQPFDYPLFAHRIIRPTSGTHLLYSYNSCYIAILFAKYSCSVVIQSSSLYDRSEIYINEKVINHLCHILVYKETIYCIFKCWYFHADHTQIYLCDKHHLQCIFIGKGKFVNMHTLVLYFLQNSFLCN